MGIWETPKPLGIRKLSFQLSPLWLEYLESVLNWYLVYVWIHYGARGVFTSICSMGKASTCWQQTYILHSTHNIDSWKSGGSSFMLIREACLLKKHFSESFCKVENFISYLSPLSYLFYEFDLFLNYLLVIFNCAEFWNWCGDPL